MPRSIPILSCCAAVLLATGCGSSSSHRLSRTEFQHRANRVCDRLSRQEQSNLASKAGLDQNIHRLDSAVGQLESLHPPAGDEQRYGDLLTRLRRSVAFVKANESRLLQLAGRLRTNPSDTQTQARYRRLVGPLERDVQAAGVDAKALGLPACASGLSSGSSG